MRVEQKVPVMVDPNGHVRRQSTLQSKHDRESRSLHGLRLCPTGRLGARYFPPADRADHESARLITHSGFTPHGDVCLHTT